MKLVPQKNLLFYLGIDSSPFRVAVRSKWFAAHCHGNRLFYFGCMTSWCFSVPSKIFLLDIFQVQWPFTKFRNLRKHIWTINAFRVTKSNLGILMTKRIVLFVPFLKLHLCMQCGRGQLENLESSPNVSSLQKKLRISSSSQPFSSNTILKHYLFRFVAYTPRGNGFVHCYYPLKANNLLSASALNSSRRSVSNLGWMQKFSEFWVFFTLLLVNPN